MNFQLILLLLSRNKNIPKQKYAEHALVMHSSSLCKPHTAFYLNELLTKLMNISFFFMKPFNSPNRGNDILSSANVPEERGENSIYVDDQVTLCNIRGCIFYCHLYLTNNFNFTSHFVIVYKHTFTISLTLTWLYFHTHRPEIPLYLKNGHSMI